MNFLGGLQASMQRVQLAAAHFLPDRLPMGESRAAAAKLGGDAWRSVQATSARTLSPGFGEAMKDVSRFMKQNGNYADATGPLRRALDASVVTAEALEVARFATDLSARYHPDNAAVITPAFRQATALAQSAPEAFNVVKEIVKTRQVAFALFPLGERHDVLEGAVGKWATIDGRVGRELARDAFKLVKFSEFAKTTEQKAIRRISVMDTPEQWVTSISNYLRKALE